MEGPSSSSSAIPWFGSNKDEHNRSIFEEEIFGVPRWMREALKTAFNGSIKQEDKKKIASKSRIIASKKDRRIVLKKKKRVVTNVYDKRNEQQIAKWLDINQLPTISTTVEPATPKMGSDSSTTVEPSTSKMESDPSLTVEPRTQIPKNFEWIRATSTVKEREEAVAWARRTARELESTNPDESERLLDWAAFLFDTIVLYPEPQMYNIYLGWALSTSTKEAPDERKRLSKVPHSTARTAPDERKRWSLQEEILKPFEIALGHIQREMDNYAEKHLKKYKENNRFSGFHKRREDYPHVNQEHMIYTLKGKHGLYECRNALWIWTKYLYFPGISLKKRTRGPIYFGEKIKDNFPESDMINGRPSVNDLGFVTIELSGKWIAERINKMLKDGLHTWAPKLTVERVFVVRPSFKRTNVDLARRFAIADTLTSMLEFSNVDALLIGYEDAYKDTFALWNQLCFLKADWIVYITPVWHHVYPEMCLAAAEKCISGYGTRTSYAGYQVCNTAALEDNLLDKARTRLGGAAHLLGYSAEAILECVLK